MGNQLESVLTNIVGAVPASPGIVILRTALVSTMALAFLAGLTTSADAYHRRLGYSPFHSGWYGDFSSRRVRVTSHSRRERSEPRKDPGFGEMPKGPLQIAVNISTQKVTLYSNGVQVAQGPISTGMPGHPTPMGVFTIIEKDRYHHSNIYSGAPMPYMQRITWSGVAIHEGVLPGRPASHGCIRTSHDFAQKLWPITKLGVRFVVSRHEIVPVAFEHPKLFVPSPKPPEPKIALDSATEGRPERPIKLVQNESRSVETPMPVPADLRKSVEVPAATETPPADDLAKPVPTDDPARPVAPSRMKSADQPVKRTGQVAVFVSRKEKKIFVRQGMVPMFDMPVTIAELDRPLGLHVFTALGPNEDGSGMRWNLMTVPTDGIIYEDYRRMTRRRWGREPAPMPVAPSQPPSTAAEALERIEFPKEAIDRISELLIPGSSLVIADDGLGRETGRMTEFIVLTH
jgi:L,D-transpeptidase catalytic domain